MALASHLLGISELVMKMGSGLSVGGGHAALPQATLRQNSGYELWNSKRTDLLPLAGAPAETYRWFPAGGEPRDHSALLPVSFVLHPWCFSWPLEALSQS